MYAILYSHNEVELYADFACLEPSDLELVLLLPR